MNKKFVLLSALFLMNLPALAETDCTQAKERYWQCIRAAVTNDHPCKESDNITIPPECLIGGAEEQAKENPETDSTKAELPFDYEPEIIQRKPVEVLNIKALQNKPYIETEDEADQFSITIRENLLKAIKEGKKVRLQFD
ncbi:MAG: hypothetical protein PHQ03_02840 [Methylococcales bacterium]|nr:hypothetical protein [Methylococcales bacterium]